MDSISKSEPFAESSSTTPSKTGEQQKDSQTKSSSSTATHTSVTSTSAGGATTTDTSTTKSVTISLTSPLPQTTPSTTSGSGSGPQSVTISLGVGALQVGKSHPRIPSPPKPIPVSTSQDVTSTGATASTGITSSSKPNIATKDTSKSASDVSTPFSSSSATTDPTFQKEAKTTSSSTTASQSQPSITKPSITPPVAPEHPTTGGASSTSSSSLSAMKRPSEASGTSNSGSGATVESAESETGSEHKRKKMRKDRSDSPGNTPHATSSSRGPRTSGSGNVQGNPSSTANSTSTAGEVKGNGSSVSSHHSSGNAGGSDSASSAQEKSDEGNNRNCESTVSSSSSVANPNTASSNPLSTSGNSGNGFGLSTAAGGSGGPKVPPLKIVLQSHAHSSTTTQSTTSGSASVTMSFKTSNAQEEAATQNPAFGGGGGFSYVVSSSNDSNPSGNPSSNNNDGGVGGGPPLQLGKSAVQVGSSETREIAAGAQNKDAQRSNVGGSLTGSELSTGTSSVPSHSTFMASSVTVDLNLPTVVCGSSDNKSKETSLSGNEGSASGGAHTKNVSIDEDGVKKDKPNVDVGSSVLPASSGNTHQSSIISIMSEQEKEKEVVVTTMKEKESFHQQSNPKADATTAGPGQKEKEKPVRVTRSSQRILKEGGGTHTPNSPSSSSPKTSACPSPSHSHQTDSQGSVETALPTKQGSGDGTEKMDTSEPVELHPRKRKLKNKEGIQSTAPPTVTVQCAPTPPAATVTTASASASTCSISSGNSSGENSEQHSSNMAANEQPMLNCFEMYLNIRKQIDRRRRNLFPVTPKPPKGFKDYLMNRGTYVLAGNANAVAVPLINPPPCLSTQMKDFFSEQENERHRLRLQHLVEKEKLVLSVEQEILRVHGRAARALSNQTLPFSVCTILKDQEVYNLLTPEQEEKDINARSRYNGRLFLSWLQDVDDKWDKIKEYMLLRHHNEAESLHAVQKMDWEWKLKEFGLCEPKANPLIDDLSVPMVHVSDDFDLGAP